MTNPKNVKPGYVKKESVIVMVSIALIIGFIGGVVYTSFKQTSNISSSGVPQQKQFAGKQDVSSDMIQELELETVNHPDNVNAWVRLGNAYFDTDNFEKAIAAYKKSITLDPTSANVWTDMGVMYRRNGQPEEAVKAFDEAIKADPLHEISRMNKGIVMMHDLSNSEGAIAAWEGLLLINPLASTANGQPVIELVETLKKSLN